MAAAQTATIIDLAERRQARLAQRRSQGTQLQMPAAGVAIAWVPIWFVPIVMPADWSVG